MPGDAAALRAESARLREANERLRVLLEDKDAKIAEPEEKVARLERLISRNSGNSSMPPSADDLPGRKPPRAEGPPRRREEAQAGQAAGRAGHVPGVESPPGQDPGRVTGLPEARAETIQYDRHEVECTCGRRHLADAPAEAGAAAPGTVSSGLGLQAWCGFLRGMHHVPVERCADIIE